MSEGITNLRDNPGQIQSLKDNLEGQAVVYKQLHALEQEKKDALIKNNIQDIETITAREQKLLRTVNRLEGERLSCVKEVAHALERTPEEMTLAELAESFPVLSGVRADLEQVVWQLREIQSMNAQLLIQAMRVVNYTLDLLTYEQGNTYGPADVKTNRSYDDNNKKKQLIDWRI